MSHPDPRPGNRKRSLMREVLITQLVYAAVVGTIAIGSLAGVANWVVRDNLDDWSSRWIGELETLGAGLYTDDPNNEEYLGAQQYIDRYPEVTYVRYYDSSGAVIYAVGGDEEIVYTRLNGHALNDLARIAHDIPSHQVDETLEPLLRISRAIVTQSIEPMDLFAADTVDDLRTASDVAGFVELGLDYGRYDQNLIGSLGTGSVFVLIAFLMLTLAGRIILRRGIQPLADIEGPIRQMAEGDLDIKIPVTRHREISAIANALQDAASKIRERDQRLSRLANYDSLTGLANRRHFVEKLSELLNGDNVSGALLFIDLDRFKYVNDTVGHQAGDAVLAQVADRIKRSVRGGDLIARLGGDEFVMFLPRIDSPRAESIATKLIHDLGDYPFNTGDQSFTIACSVGASIVTSDNGYTPTELISQADLACRKAKEDGRNRMRMYSPSEGEIDVIRSDLAWRKELKRALKESNFVLHYQPILDVATNKVTHFEALVRVDDGDAIRYPDAFLSAATRFGLMEEIDRWVIDHAVGDLAKYQVERPNLKFSINVTGSTLVDETFAAYVSNVLKRHDVKPESVVLEITEQIAISGASTIAQIKELAALGLEFAVDDFGTGYSSLSYLKELPVQYIKIDGSFVRKLAESTVDQTIVRAIADIARIMGKRTVAEFVGDEKTLSIIREIGIDYAQGSLVGKPEEVLGADIDAAQIIDITQHRPRRLAPKNG